MLKSGFLTEVEASQWLEAIGVGKQAADGFIDIVLLDQDLDQRDADIENILDLFKVGVLSFE